MGDTFEDLLFKMSPDQLAANLEKAKALLAASDTHATSLGHLCVAYAGLDSAIASLYEPLLQCTPAQAACLVDENISRRCAVAIKLLHLTELPPKLIDWIVRLLRRCDGELAAERNRHIHDNWHVDPGSIKRIDARAKLGKPQSRQPATVIYNTEHPTTIEDVDRLCERVTTVSIALAAADSILRKWRQTGRRPKLDPEWLPACTPKSRCTNFQALAKSLERPLSPLVFEYD